MAKPVILAVDDDPQGRRGGGRGPQRRDGRGERGFRAGSGKSALDTLSKLKLRGDPVALFLVDQRMPKMTGVEFLEEAIERYPEAKRALLTAYSDTEAAIRAINDVGLDYYLQKPWDPPEEKLYPDLDDMLGDWRADYRPPFTGLRVVGDRWSPESHRTREFLARNRVPYKWMDIEGSEEAREVVASADHGAPKLPLVVYEDGTYDEAPGNLELADKIGLQTRAGQQFYDLLIVGGGPSGLAAAVYGASEGLSTVLVEREAPGGQAGTSSRIENYLGFPAGLSGADLARRAVDQARRFKVEILTPQEVSDVRVEDPYRIVTLSDGSEISCYALIVTTGVSCRRLDMPGADRLTGAGVYFVGGANSAGQSAMFFSNQARKVVMVCRGDDLRKSMSEFLVAQIEDRENIEVRLNSNVVAAEGEEHLERITIEDSESGETETATTGSLFIFIGAAPKTGWLEGVVERDDRGFILSGPDISKNGKRPRGWALDRDPFLLETSVPGVFVAGDVRHGSIKRCASAVGEGSIAVQFVHQYLREV